MIYARGGHFCLSNVRVFIGKPFHYQALVACPLSTTMTIGTNLSIPLPIPTVKHQEKKNVLFDHIFCRPFQNARPTPSF
jgi:hypothetical protein